MNPETPHESAIHRAARSGDVEQLQRLIAAGANINERASVRVGYGVFLEELTPLMVAAASREGASVATLQWLLGHGADLHAVSRAGVTAAWYAAGWGVWITRWPTSPPDPNHVDRLRYLLDAGLDPHESAPNGRSLLAEACRAGDTRRVRLLLDRGVSAGPADPGRSPGECGASANRGCEVSDDRPLGFQIPLFMAAESGSADCVRLLIEAGADVKQREKSGRTALMYAANGPVAEFLISAGADPQAEDTSGEDVLNQLLDVENGPSPARGEDLYAVGDALLAAGVSPERRSRYGTTRLYDAAFRHSAEGVEFLLRCGADPHADQGGGTNALFAISWQGEYSGNEERTDACVRIIELLVAAGIDPNRADDRGWTPLHKAAGGDWGNVSAIRTLLRLGARPDSVDHQGVTPLMQALIHSEVDCVRVLLAAGADVRRVDKSGRSVIQQARDWAEAYKTQDARAVCALVEGASQTRCT